MQATQVCLVWSQKGVCADAAAHSLEAEQPQVPVAVMQVGVVPEQAVTSVQPVPAALQICASLPEHWVCVPAVQVAATQVPFEQMGVSGVPAQSGEEEQPQVPVDGWHTGATPAQVVTPVQPVPVALQTCASFPEHRRSVPATQVAAMQVPFEQMGVVGVPVQSFDEEQPHVPLEVWQTGVSPAQGVSSVQPVSVVLQIC